METDETPVGALNLGADRDPLQLAREALNNQLHKVEMDIESELVYNSDIMKKMQNTKGGKETPGKKKRESESRRPRSPRRRKQTMTFNGSTVDISELDSESSLYKIAQVCFLNGLPEQQQPSDEVQYELNLPDPEPHTEQTSSIKPPKKRLTSAEIDDILKKSATATSESILEANLTQAKIVRQWWQARYAHRWHRYRKRLKTLIENNTNTMTATDELMTKYIAKLG